MRSLLLLAVTAHAACPGLVKPTVGPRPDDLPRATTADSAPPSPAAPVAAPTPSVPKEATHPAVAWFIAKTGEVPGLALGGVGTAAPPADVLQGFLLERAAVDIAPACLRERGLNKSAAQLQKITSIHDAASLESAKKTLGTLRSISGAEVQAMTNYSDQANGRDAAEAIATTLDQISSGAPKDLELKSLAGWAGLLEVCFDKDRPAIVERNLSQLLSLLKTGKAPARGAGGGGRRVHPAIETYLRIAGGQLSVGEYANLLAIDVTDTWRGGNLELELFASDISLRELAPAALERCGAKDEAAQLSKLPPVRSAAQLEQATKLLFSFDGENGPNRWCITGVQNLTHQITSEAYSGLSYQKSGINAHPYYARSAIVGWLRYRQFWADSKLSEPEIAKLTQQLLIKTVTKLRALALRKEPSREPS
ncbi:MAG: hypothetical protein U1E65_28295 [Myxococcota bacterium]